MFEATLDTVDDEPVCSNIFCIVFIEFDLLVFFERSTIFDVSTLCDRVKLELILSLLGGSTCLIGPNDRSETLDFTSYIELVLVCDDSSEKCRVWILLPKKESLDIASLNKCADAGRLISFRGGSTCFVGPTEISENDSETFLTPSSIFSLPCFSSLLSFFINSPFFSMVSETNDWLSDEEYVFI
ncbi:hypothetical protein AGLY_012781 [Aphis glycines]|uniref:Uncharacterized protein n=1 Tax=Aphis glycines TaxID=307491 RepID=A0A6G0T839_APHGL|nr:hypothetical protein AGLY_012781 [Aphis glycines]